MTFQTVEQLQAQIASLTAEIERLKAAMTPDYFYGEGLEDQVFDSVLAVLEEFESEDPFLEPVVVLIDTAIRGPRIWVSVTPANNADGFLYRQHDSQAQANEAIADIAAALAKEREEDALALKNMELNR